ncbi:MAG: hypothetical protein IIX60_02690 [Clostridia bacterium]|nr:hypothetical protein [Clostridia bacterium]
MYKISVPVMNRNIKRNNRERLLKEIKRFDAERIFLALSRYSVDKAKREEELKELENNCKFFKQHGFEVGAWLWTFGIKDNTTFTNMRSIKGTEIKDTACPAHDDFVEFAADYLSDIASRGVDLIMFDDDYRYGFLSDAPACLCERHIELINKVTGESSTREELEHHIMTGGKNKYRDAYLKVNGDVFKNFASTIRAAIDKVNPNIRLGACTCMTAWDIDGTNAYELSKILAGNTKPFVRLIGAPYWAVKTNWGNTLADTIEVERMESVWTKHDDIEIMAEGDTFPRPRMNCPASYLEGFDLGIRASGCTDGILKYGIDYTSNAAYETGYAVFHERNRQLYKAVDKAFGDKKNCGVRVYESMKKVSDMVMPTKVNKWVDLQNLFFSRASRSLVSNSIPTVYEGDGVCGIVFDENARNMPLSAVKNGLILDIAAAEILTERGVDVGLEKIGDVITQGIQEHYLNEDNYVSAQGGVAYDITVKDSAEILSDAETHNGKVPLSYRYENADGNRFLVLNINARCEGSGMLKHYARGRQYANNIEWLSGKKLPAYVYGNPSLYVQSKKDENAMAVGLWNFFADIAVNPVVHLDKEYSEIEFINCSGELKGDKVHLSDIPAFGFVGFEVK